MLQMSSGISTSMAADPTWTPNNKPNDDHVPARRPRRYGIVPERHDHRRHAREVKARPAKKARRKQKPTFMAMFTPNARQNVKPPPVQQPQAPSTDYKVTLTSAQKGEFDNFLDQKSERDPELTIGQHCLFLHGDGKERLLNNFCEGGTTLMSSETQSRKSATIVPVSFLSKTVGLPSVSFIAINHPGVQEVAEKIGRIKPAVAEDSTANELDDEAKDSTANELDDAAREYVAELNRTSASGIIYHFMNGKAEEWDKLRKEPNIIEYIKSSRVHLVMSCHTDTLSKFHKFISECVLTPSLYRS